MLRAVRWALVSCQCRNTLLADAGTRCEWLSNPLQRLVPFSKGMSHLMLDGVQRNRAAERHVQLQQQAADRSARRRDSDHRCSQT